MLSKYVHQGRFLVFLLRSETAITITVRIITVFAPLFTASQTWTSSRLSTKYTFASILFNQLFNLTSLSSFRRCLFSCSRFNFDVANLRWHDLCQTTLFWQSSSTEMSSENFSSTGRASNFRNSRTLSRKAR